MLDQVGGPQVESNATRPTQEPLSNEALDAAEARMEHELAKLFGMHKVKEELRKMVLTLRMNHRRRLEGLENSTNGFKHMIFTGNLQSYFPTHLYLAFHIQYTIGMYD